MSNRQSLFRFLPDDRGAKIQSMEQKSNEKIYRVRFKEPPSGQANGDTDFLFGGLSAIYEVFTEEQIGCKVTHLWNYGIMEGRPYVNKKVTISREPLYRKKRNSADLARQISEPDNSYGQTI